MKIPISDRMRALFARDKLEFWWCYYTDDEKKLRRMDVWQLADVIGQNDPGSAKSVVAEHLLSIRLVRMQTRATYVSIFFGLVGVVVGAFLF